MTSNPLKEQFEKLSQRVDTLTLKLNDTQIDVVDVKKDVEYIKGDVHALQSEIKVIADMQIGISEITTTLKDRKQLMQLVTPIIVSIFSAMLIGLISLSGSSNDIDPEAVKAIASEVVKSIGKP